MLVSFSFFGPLVASGGCARRALVRAMEALRNLTHNRFAGLRRAAPLYALFPPIAIVVVFTTMNKAWGPQAITAVLPGCAAPFYVSFRLTTKPWPGPQATAVR